VFWTEVELSMSRIRVGSVTGLSSFLGSYDMKKIKNILIYFVTLFFYLHPPVVRSHNRLVQ
jgi:hypothetical protein